MAEKSSNRSAPVIIAAIVILLILAAVAAYFIGKPSSEARPVLESALAAVEPLPADSHVGQAAADCFSIKPAGEVEQHYRKAYATVDITTLDTAALGSDTAAELQAALAERVAAAKRPADVYDGDNRFLPSVLEEAYAEVIDARLEHAADYLRTDSLELSLSYGKGRWQLDNAAELESMAVSPVDPLPGYDEAAAQAEYIEFHYSLPDWTSPGPRPDKSRFGETDDPQVISELLETEAAKKLIDGQKLDWNADKELIEGSSIHYYLDDTILAIVWQEDEHGAVGTFAEVFISDASQLRRKLADDTFGGQTYYYPTDLARQSNAVLAVSGDFYDHPDRIYGVYAYNGKVMLSCLTAGQTCYFTDTGDMIFSYESQFESNEAAQAFLDDNNVMFSLSFGPVMVEKGIDVTPYDYPLGEVRDTYARCAVGQLGKLHYLAMTINCQQPDHYVYVTLRQAADSMIAHGCYNAYTLDGGQTGSIIIDGTLINPVQFGVERTMSDIFYFATAIPDD